MLHLNISVYDSQVSEQPQSDFDDSEQVFEEDGNLIKMKVQADEDDFSDGSREEGELNDDDSETDNETENESENETEGEPSEVDPNRSSDEQYSDDLRVSQNSESPRRPRCKWRRSCRRHRSMEKKLDGLSNAVMVLQNMFVQQGMGKELAVTPSKTKIWEAVQKIRYR